MTGGGACLQRVPRHGVPAMGQTPGLAIAPGHRGARTGISARTRVPPPTGLSTVSVPSSAATRSCEAGEPAPVRAPRAADRRRRASRRAGSRRLGGRHAGRARAGVLGHVGQRLGDDEVGRRLDRRRIALLGGRRPRPAAARDRPAPRRRPRGRGWSGSPGGCRARARAARRGPRAPTPAPRRPAVRRRDRRQRDAGPAADVMIACTKRCCAPSCRSRTTRRRCS